MKSGKLKDKITLISVTNTIDSIGSPIQTEVEGKTIWCDWQTLSVKEYFDFKTSNQIEAKVITRFRTDITEDMKIKYENEIYEIVSVIDNKNEHKQLNILVEKVK